MKQFSTPIRRLEGITYWVIDDTEGIRDHINTEIRKEWEADARSERRNPSEDPWLNTLAKRKWNLEVVNINEIKLNPDVMNYVDNERGYDFGDSLKKRARDLQREIETYALVIWPVIVRKEDRLLVDGYCRYSVLKAMKIREIYAYLGSLQGPKVT